MTTNTKKWLLTCFSLLIVALVFTVGTISSSAYSYSVYPMSVSFSNPNNVPFETFGFISNDVTGDELGLYTVTQPTPSIATVSTVNGQTIITIDGYDYNLSLLANLPDGKYCVAFVVFVTSNDNAYITPNSYTGGYARCDEADASLHFYYNTGNSFVLEQNNDVTNNTHITMLLTPYDEVAGGGTPTDCPTLEEQIGDYNGSWYEFEQMLKANNYELWLKYSSELADFGSIQYSQGLTQGYQNGYTGALGGNNIEDPIDQYWNSTKDYVLIAGQPYFAPNGFGTIDAYNTIGIYGEHNSFLHKQDGSTQVFNGQYVTEFASAGTLGGGWYKIGATVGDENAYEQSFNVSAMDKAYYVARVSPLGDPVEEFLVAIWLDGYEAWYVAEDYVHYGTVAKNNKSYKQVYSIYMTDIRPTSQRFVNYDNPILYETFTKDVNATLYLATFNQLNNYNVYTDDIGIVESYNNGFDAGANTTLWLDLLSQPIVAFFSIPLAQVIVEGVTYTLTYGIVLGAGIVALIVVWFLKLFAGG